MPHIHKQSWQKLLVYYQQIFAKQLVNNIAQLLYLVNIKCNKTWGTWTNYLFDED